MKHIIILTVLIFLALQVRGQEIKTIQGQEYLVDTIRTQGNSTWIKFTVFDTTFTQNKLEQLRQDSIFLEEELERMQTDYQERNRELRQTKRKIRRVKAILNRQMAGLMQGLGYKDSPY